MESGLDMSIYQKKNLSGARIVSKAVLIPQVIRCIGVLLIQNIMTEIGSVLTGNVNNTLTMR